MHPFTNTFFLIWRQELNEGSSFKQHARTHTDRRVRWLHLPVVVFLHDKWVTVSAVLGPLTSFLLKWSQTMKQKQGEEDPPDGTLTRVWCHQVWDQYVVSSVSLSHSIWYVDLQALTDLWSIIKTAPCAKKGRKRDLILINHIDALVWCWFFFFPPLFEMLKEFMPKGAAKLFEPAIIYSFDSLIPGHNVRFFSDPSTVAFRKWISTSCQDRIPASFVGRLNIYLKWTRRFVRGESLLPRWLDLPN